MEKSRANGLVEDRQQNFKSIYCVLFDYLHASVASLLDNYIGT